MLRWAMLLGKDKPTIFLRLLAVMSLLLFGLMLPEHQRYHSVLGRYSLRYTIYSLEILALAICFALLSVRAYRERLFCKVKGHLTPRVANLIVYGALASIPIFYALHRLILRERQKGYIDNSLLILLLLPLLAAWLLNRYGQLENHGSPWRLLVVALFVLHLLIIANFLGDIPPFHAVDDPWEVAAAVRIARNPGSLNSINFADKNFEFNAPFFQQITGNVLSLIGEGWLQARLFYLFIGALACPFIYAIARRLYGPIAAWAAALLAFYLPFHHNWARPDIWVPTATTIALYFYLLSRDEKTKQPQLASVACGFFIVSAIDGHSYGVFFALSLSLWQLHSEIRHLHRNGWQLRLSARFRYYFLGCALYTLFWSWYHLVLPGIQLVDLPSLLANEYQWQGGLREEIGLSRIFANIHNLLQLYQPMEAYLGIVLTTIALYRRKREEFFLFFIFGCSVLLLVIILAHENRYYPQYWIPLWALWFGAAVQTLSQNMGRLTHQNDRRRLGMSNGAILFMVSALLMLTVLVYEKSNRPVNLRQRIEYESMVDAGRELDEYLPSEDIHILGNYPMLLSMLWRDNYHPKWRGQYLLPGKDGIKPDAIIIVPDLEPWSYTADLRDYLAANSYNPAVCLSFPDPKDEWWQVVGEGKTYTAMLYLLPEVKARRVSDTCTPELLSQFSEP